MKSSSFGLNHYIKYYYIIIIILVLSERMTILATPLNHLLIWYIAVFSIGCFRICNFGVRTNLSQALKTRSRFIIFAPPASPLHKSLMLSLINRTNTESSTLTFPDSELPGRVKYVPNNSGFKSLKRSKKCMVIYLKKGWKLKQFFKGEFTDMRTFTCLSYLVENHKCKLYYD